ncbi:chromosome partitioning protein ParA [Helicobacter sp. 13S00482-2]|uniref:ParA family protein n=1 Tax=Helicobacter sp. 13S00482-2 TaxID=1476200 RepID=UPI000BA72BD9|nr:ParA family protein [Helicobacter sp. 13S00482-2]PAF52949.1 chromosome partitioning protein ParA [Helicobacter sp. 13S00482-2]
MIITIANQKGGSGKSTLCLNLATKLLLENQDVVVLDTDVQRSIETFVNIRVDKNIKCFSLFNRTGNITDTIKQMIPKYQNIIIDTKGEDSLESRKAMLISDLVIIPSTPSQLDVAVLNEMFKRVGEIESINENLKACVVMNRIPPVKYLREKEAMREFILENKESFDIELLETIISERISLKRCVSDGFSIFEYNDEKAKKEFCKFYQEIYEKFFKEKTTQSLKIG